MILLDKVNKEIESLIKLKEILEKTEIESTLNINCKLEDSELDKIFIENLKKITTIMELKGIYLEENYCLKNYFSIYEDSKDYIVSIGSSEVSAENYRQKELKIKK